MRRREFITLLGGAAVSWPLAARAQQPTLPVVGFLGSGSPQSDAFRMAAIRKGLNESGYIGGRNVVFEYRWAENQDDRLPELAADLVRHKVAVIVLFGNASAAAAKSATATIPIVFATGSDPIKSGLVTSLSRPGGNMTGVSFLINALVAKQVEVLHEMIPNAALIGYLVNPTNPAAGIDTKNALAAAASVGQKLAIIKARTDKDLESAFVTLIQQRADALVVAADLFFTDRRDKIVELAARQKMPTVYPLREFVEAGGLMSYGASLTDALRLVGLAAGRILKGEKPVDMPVQQSSKVELIINLKTAKTLGLTIPLPLLGRADEMIE